MRLSTLVLAVVVALPLGLLVAGQAGWLAGRRPADLGVHDGRLKAPSRTDNSVSSQAAAWPGHPQREAAAIEPLPWPAADPAAAMARLQAAALALPGAQRVDARPDYLYVQYRTRWLGFVDDAEFWLDPVAKVIQVRSASRVGRRDFGVNRARIEAIRRALAAG